MAWLVAGSGPGVAAAAMEMAKPIRSLHKRFDINELRQQLGANPDIWNLYPFRTTNPNSPHREVNDVWVRYNAIENLGPTFNEPHESVWYPVAEKIPAVKTLCEEVLQEMGATEFGGVLITQIPAHAQVYPHSDHGWHAERYEKFAVLLRGNSEQSFCFDGYEHRCEPGDSFTFINQYRHWVLNPTDEPRETLIVCARRH